LIAFEDQDAPFSCSHEVAATPLPERLARHLHGPGVLVLSDVPGVGNSSLIRARVLRGIGAGLASPPRSAWRRLLFTATPVRPDELARRGALP